MLLLLLVCIHMATRIWPACGHPPPPRHPLPQATHTGTFNRALGASGFSLVNVANVPISLGRWVVGNDPAFT